MLSSATLTKIIPALIKAQAAFKPAVKDAVNAQFAKGGTPKPSYVSLAQAIESVAGALRDNGIALLQQTDVQDAQTLLITTLMHESGEWIAGRYPVHPVKADPQGEGSALTYARRYALMALVGIAPEDDDGNAATKAANKSAVTTINASPHDGVWEALDADQQAGVRNIGVIANEFAETGDIPAMYAYIQKQGLDTDEKAALNMLFDAPTRSALKREHTLQTKGAKAA